MQESLTTESVIVFMQAHELKIQFRQLEFSKCTLRVISTLCT